MYKLFHQRVDKLLDALGVARLMPWRRVKADEFWALRGIDLEIKAGSRVGIIGRNGAGKRTLLKPITDNLAPTERTVQVNRQVQSFQHPSDRSFGGGSNGQGKAGREELDDVETFDDDARSHRGSVDS